VGRRPATTEDFAAYRRQGTAEDYAVFRQGIAEDYAVFRETIRAVVGPAAEGIKLEIRDQHQQTRAKVETARHEILSAIKSSPAEFVKLISEFGSLFLLFCLAVRFTFGIQLLNSAFAVFMLFALGLYWVMARLKQRSEKRANGGGQA